MSFIEGSIENKRQDGCVGKEWLPVYQLSILKTARLTVS